jgi:phage recombination protein Bet
MNELVTRESALTISGDQIDLIKRTVAKDATADELKLYFYDCQRQGVHPLDKLIHFTKRGGRYVPITSIDFLRMKSGETKAYAGSDDAVFTGVPGDADFAAKVEVYRLVQGQRCAWSATARWSEYYPGDQQGHMWKKMPHVMLAKCAEALALRKAFADVLHGLYIREEMDQAEPSSVMGDNRSRLKEQLRREGAAPGTPPPAVSASAEDNVKQDPPTSADAPSSSDEPPEVESWRAKIRTAHDSKAAQAIYNSVPEAIRQECFACYSDKLKSFNAKRKA